MLSRRWRFILGVLVLFLVAALFLVYSSMSYLTRELAEKRVPGLTFSDLQIGWNLLTIRGIRYVDPESERLLLSAESLVVSPSFTSFFSDEIKVSSIEIEDPYVFILRDPEGHLQLPLPRRNNEPAQVPESLPSEQSSNFQIAIDEITGTGGSGDYIDQTVTGPDASYRFSDLNFSVQGIRHPPQSEPVEFDVEALVDGSDNSQLQLSGWYDFATPSADLAFRLQDFTLAQGEPYLRERIRVEEFGQGKIGADANLQMDAGRYQVDGELVLTDLVISQLQKRLLGFPTEALQIFLKDMGKQMIVPFHFEGTLGEEREPFDPGALLIRRLEEELGSNADLLDLLRDEDTDELKNRLEEIKKKGERLRELFR